MKKIFTIAISLIFALTISANENKMANTEALSMNNVKIERLSMSLNASIDQIDAINNVMTLFVSQMETIKTESSINTRKKMFDNAVRMNINYMRSILDENQFKRYLAILNSTLVNRGLI